MKIDLPAILVANDLLTGRIVVWGERGFSRNPQDATIATTLDIAENLQATGLREFASLRVVDPEVIPVTIDAGVPMPKHLRERIKLFGPTIALDGVRLYV
jgi:hypothetical protein